MNGARDEWKMHEFDKETLEAKNSSIYRASRRVMNIAMMKLFFKALKV